MALIFAAAILIPKFTNANKAEITFYHHKAIVDLTDYKTYTLSELFDDNTDSLPRMTFTVDENGIKIQTSDCPGGDCIKQGYAGVIICVPNKVTVRLVDEEPLFDAVI
jgi:hypothetical protein